MALVGACELIIIATAILLLALSARRRRQVVKWSEQVVPMKKTLPAVPNQQALADYFNMAQEISASNGLLGRFRAQHLAGFSGDFTLPGVE